VLHEEREKGAGEARSVLGVVERDAAGRGGRVMAHTDACKYQVCQLVERLVKNGQSVNEASKHVQVESDGIPAKTIQRWWRQIQDEANGLLNNEQQPENPATMPVQGGCTGCKLDPVRVVSRIDKMVEQGKSIREASEVIAKETGRRPSAIRSAYVRERDKLAPEDEPSEAWQFVEIAISQLSRIRKDDPGRKEAFQKLKNWIAVQEGK